MNDEYKLTLIGCFTIAAFDGLSSIASRSFNFNYSLLVAVSFMIYAVFGYLIARVTNIRKGILCSATLGLFDASAGWKIAILLKANTGDIVSNTPDIGKWVFTAIFVMVLAALAVLIGGSLSLLTKNR